VFSLAKKFDSGKSLAHLCRSRARGVAVVDRVSSRSNQSHFSEFKKSITPLTVWVVALGLYPT
jgi:hypothetical protein